MEEKDYKYIVGVQCMTFNQSKYILDALNGFVMQQTTFPFVIMVVDDASTDGEQDVIAKFISEQFDINDPSVAYEKDTDYAHISYAQHKTNKNCYIAALYLKENHHSQRKTKMPYLSEWRDNIKYEALCEGDDYWINMHKLQMQVDFMENNQDYSMCFHNATVIYDDIVKKPVIFCNIIDCKEIFLEELIDNWIAPTASLLYRKEIINNYPEWTKEIYSGDLTLQLIAYSKGKIYYFNKVMSIYRKTYNNTVSVSSNISKCKPRDFVYKQHALLFRYYDKYTNYKYHDILRKRIVYKEKCGKYAIYKNKGIFYTIIRMPLFCLSKLINKMK